MKKNHTQVNENKTENNRRKYLIREELSDGGARNEMIKKQTGKHCGGL
ncbi:hypothetical protein [Texcoconibacillus texcoconensis]|uniref:Uncharacterized protein n=1 Tax=Texcoconibacillus texcoconensis TaxID=1095777 RepID=A0A840QT44_9BACI|nr:hypothetical protein [Texcoconibacillus texcoconensis]MBB5174483.1 hypothetical protein [Texcoconibacillus texcoconensis]